MSAGRRARALRTLALAALASLNAACATLSQQEYARAEAIAVAARSETVVCAQADACAKPSPLRELGVRAMTEAMQSRPVGAIEVDDDTHDDAHNDAQADARGDWGVRSGPASGAESVARADVAPPPDATAQSASSAPSSRHASPLHYALILDYGQDALLARLNLIRGAQRSIDIQTFIFDEDDAGHLVLDELLVAAQRGVKVRVLIDQLSALRRVDTLAALAAAHVNFEMRVYNPVLGRARFSYPMYAWATVCCFRRLNQRMHNKLMLVDGLVAITGGRNYQNDYFDWNPTYNFRDRDVLVAGPVAVEMGRNFDAYWDAPLSMPLTKLSDVGKRLIDGGVPALAHPAPAQPLRIEAIGRDADDEALIRSRLADAALPVRGVSFIGDVPEKHHRDDGEGGASSQVLRELIESAEREVLLQTPYLVMSKPAQRMFRDLQTRARPPRVRVSTNSLAATDAFIPYALSYKYKRRFLRDFKFEIHEFKPFPKNAPIDLEATGAVELQRDEDGSVQVVAQKPRKRNLPLSREHLALRYSSRGANQPVPLRRAGVRFGLHAKSLVIDGRVGVIGTHNFDPRGENYNTEMVVIVDDPTFARLLATSIERDMAPENAWLVARRDRSRYFGGLEYSLAKIAEHLPVFDFWPVRYATTYEFVPGPECPGPMSPRDPEFRRCYEPTGDFPEVGIVIRPLTRIFVAFGAGLAPIL